MGGGFRCVPYYEFTCPFKAIGGVLQALDWDREDHVESLRRRYVLPLAEE